MARNVQLIIVCEDVLHEVFVRAFLRRRGIKPMFFVKPPKGRGDAKQHVCEECSRQLEALRRFGGNRGLIFIIDADNLNVEDRKRQVDDACKARGIEPPKETEAVFGFIPKWEVENWLAFLRDGAADEQSNKYDKYAGHESDIYPLVERLADMCEQRKLPNAPSSLVEACSVYEKFVQWKKAT